MANKLISDLTNQATTGSTFLLEVQDPATSITKKATELVVTKVERDARIAQDNVIEASCGLDADGSYPGFSGSNYLDSSTDIVDALGDLDNAISTAGAGIVVEAVGVSAANLNNAGITPYEIIAAQGVGKTIELLDCSIYLNYASSAVECGTQKLILEYSGEASHFMEWANSFIEETSDTINKGTWTSNVEMKANTAMNLTFDSGANPTAGNTTLVVWVTYIVREYAP